MYNPYFSSGDLGNYGYQQPQQNQQLYGQNYTLPPQGTGYYGQQQPQFGMQQQPGLFQGQQTGFQPQLQPQLQPQTSFQAQPTGYGAQTFQPQQTGFGGAPQYAAAPQPQLQQQKTGFLSALALVSQNQELKIPNMRLSFITAADQSKFENLFRTAVPVGENAISGDAARDILLRSGLAPVTLAEIWALSDTNKLGLLLFPEFALALSMCNSALKGDAVPRVLPEKWLNEVQSFVDAISFAVPEDPSKVLENTPFSTLNQQKSSTTDDFLSAIAPPSTLFTAQPTGSFQGSALLQQRTGGGSLIPLQPQQTAGFVPALGPLQSQRTGPLAAQGTGYNFLAPLAAQRTGLLPPTTFQAQPTGGFQQQPTGGFQAQPQPPTTFQAQPTGGFQPQATGQSQMPGSYFPSQQPLQQQLTGFQQQQQTGMMQPQRTGPGSMAPLQAQPTGKPGEWGFVSMPTGGLPGLNAMQQHFLPSSQLSSNNLQNQMGGTLKDNVGWAITKQEKLIYDGIFNAWDSNRKGFIDGDVAISIFGKSGLSRPDLETVWNLCDSSNRGKLNKDEFAVAMHLVYRRLNGLELPLRLPPELVPPSSKLLQDSVDSLKNDLKGGTASRKNSSASITAASRFKNDDDDISYVSSSRYKSKRSGDSENTSSVPNSNSNDLKIQDLKKLIREKKILLDAVNLEDQHEAIERRKNEEASTREIENLKYRIKDVQLQLTKLGAGHSDQEKSSMLQTLEHYTKDTVPQLISRISKVNAEIADVKIKLCEAQIKQKHPSWSPQETEESIVGTGPNGQVTDTDRRRFKSKQMMKQRMAALTGKTFSNGGENSEATNIWKLEVEKIKAESENQSLMVQDVLASIQELEDGALVPLSVSVKSETSSRKWEQGEGISDSVRLFVNELNAFARLQQPQAQPSVKPNVNSVSPAPVEAQHSAPQAAVPQEKPKFSTPDEKSAYVKANAGKRMQERLARLKASRTKSSTNTPTVSEAVPVAETPVVNEKAPEEVVTQQPVSQQPVSQPPVAEAKAEKDDELEDEEYAALLKQKKEMEERKKERELKRSRDKEARLEKLRKEMEALKASENNDDDWSDDDLKALNAGAVSLNNPHASKPPVTTSAPVKDVAVESSSPVVNLTPATLGQTAELSKPELASPAVPQTNGGNHDNNPFAKIGANNGTHKNSNPFFKPTNTGNSAVDSKKLENQRAAQRGLGLSDWSDDEEKSSDDEAPNRAGAAKLASLLFGGMPQPISRNPTGNPSGINSRTGSSLTFAPAEQVELPQVPQTKSQEVEQPSLPQATPESSTSVAVPPVPSGMPPLPDTMPPIPQGNPSVQPSVGNESDSEDEFATPPPSNPVATATEHIPGPPPLPVSSVPPPIPTGSAPLPPPLPTEAPPLPNFAPPPPVAPPAPPALPSGAPPPPGPPPPGPPPPPTGIAAGTPSAPLGGMPNLGALLGQIQGGKSLKKVSDTEKHVSDSAVVGRVL